MRNLYIRRKENNGKRPVVQLDAHSDEVGFMVQAICPNGTLRIIQIGGWVNHNIPAHKVLVRNRFGDIFQVLLPVSLRISYPEVLYAPALS